MREWAQEREAGAGRRARILEDDWRGDVYGNGVGSDSDTSRGT